MSLTETIEDRLPGWMRDGRDHWVKLFTAIALVTDSLIDGLFDGRLASMPGQIDRLDLGGFLSVDALPLIGRDRRIVQGFAEGPASYAARLRAWRASWRSAGTAIGLLKAIQGVMQPGPTRVCVVRYPGVWSVLDVDGTYRYITGAGGYIRHPDGTTAPYTLDHQLWFWDHPINTVSPDPYRIWIIIDAPAAPPLTDVEGVYGDGLSYFGEAGKTIGTTATESYVAMVRGIVDEWKPAGVTCPYIIINFDPTAFDPMTPGPYPAPGFPDGTWGDHGTVNGAGVRVAARNPVARYFLGPR